MDRDARVSVTTEPTPVASFAGTEIYVVPASGDPYYAVCLPAGSGTYEWVVTAYGVE